jgi:AcrR family transcriptional regulator
MAPREREALTGARATRAAVLYDALQIASVEGLEGLTVARLAEVTGMSKSGLWGLFGSKQELQLRTLELGIEEFMEAVWWMVDGNEPGRERLQPLCDYWIAYNASRGLPGGCFLTTAAVEWDARPGPLHDRVERAMREWLALLAREIARAIEKHELPADLSPQDAAFELNAIASAASWGYRLSGETKVLERARRCMRRVLQPPSASAAA